MGQLEIKGTGKCLCIYMQELADEKGISLSELASRTQIPSVYLHSILEGLIAPSLDELILMADVLGMQLTLLKTLPFAHEKIIRRSVH